MAPLNDEALQNPPKRCCFDSCAAVSPASELLAALYLSILLRMMVVMIFFRLSTCPTPRSCSCRTTAGSTNIFVWAFQCASLSTSTSQQQQKIRKIMEYSTSFQKHERITVPAFTIPKSTLAKAYTPLITTTSERQEVHSRLETLIYTVRRIAYCDARKKRKKNVPLVTAYCDARKKKKKKCTASNCRLRATKPGFKFEAFQKEELQLLFLEKNCQQKKKLP